MTRMTRHHRYVPLWQPLLFTLLLVSFVGLLLVGCVEGDEVVTPTEPTVAPVEEVEAGGGCDVAGDAIQCRDDSSTRPADRLDRVVWSAVTDGGTRVVRTIRAAPGATVVFDGLPAGEYVVEQSAVADDGSSDEATYGPFSVGLS